MSLSLVFMFPEKRQSAGGGKYVTEHSVPLLQPQNFQCQVKQSRLPESSQDGVNLGTGDREGKPAMQGHPLE